MKIEPILSNNIFGKIFTVVVFSQTSERMNWFIEYDWFIESDLYISKFIVLLYLFVLLNIILPSRAQGEKSITFSVTIAT